MLGSLQRSFKRWQDAGLLSSAQVDALRSFEKERKSGKLARDLTFVAVIAIILGLASIVASHWMAIPGGLKLAGHFLLSGVLAGLVLKLDGTRYPVRKDACLLLLFGSFLSFIALIGQVYQLHGELRLTLAFWLALCTPFIWFYGRTAMVLMPWLLLVILTAYMNLFAYVEKDLPLLATVGTVMTFYLPVILILSARVFWMVRHRPGFTQSFYRAGLILSALLAHISMLLFYEFTPGWMAHYQWQLGLMAAWLLAIFVIFKPAHKRDESAYDLWYYLLVSHIVIMLPFALPTLESGVLAAAVFIGYWLFMAWLGGRIHSTALMDWSIRLVILRLFIVYLEIFGSMLQTGVGMVVSGILLLVVLRYQNRIVIQGRKILNHEI